MKDEKNIKDYLHLYLGCQFEYTIVMADKTLIKQDGVFYLDYQFLYKWSVGYIKIKPILRPLSDMTDEEADYIGLELKAGTANVVMLKNGYYHSMTPIVFKYLLSKGFDIFGLIEAGLAIDKTKMTQQ